jgi:predicted HTH transcriptional regulator
MSDGIPLGQRESQRLEFKGADALKDPEKIAREVVAMLNAEGGEIWVGLREEEGRAVAVEAIPNAEAEGRRLLDYLVDTVEPPLRGNEVDVKPQNEGEGTVLRVVAAPEPATDRTPS